MDGREKAGAGRVGTGLWPILKLALLGPHLDTTHQFHPCCSFLTSHAGLVCRGGPYSMESFSRKVPSLDRSTTGCSRSLLGADLYIQCPLDRLGPVCELGSKAGDSK